jgi:uncharacterized protein involved in exopolysaccharide biosynthesis
MDDAPEYIKEEPKFVLYEDYKLLQQQLNDLEARVTKLEGICRNLGEQAFDLSYME